MRSHPSCWNKTLAQLGFRRKRRKVSRRQDYLSRRSLFESLEQRQMLSGDPLLDLSSDELVVSANATSEPVLLSAEPEFTLIQPETPADELEGLTAEEIASIEPIFSVETVQTKDGPKAILSFNPNSPVGPPSSLQRLTLELRHYGQVIESYDILIDVAEESFREQFLADRIAEVSAETDPLAAEQVASKLAGEATAAEIAQEVEHWTTFIGPKTLEQERRMEAALAGKVEGSADWTKLSTDNLISVAKWRSDTNHSFRHDWPSGGLPEVITESGKFYDQIEQQALQLKQDRISATTDSEQADVAKREQTLKNLTLIVAKDLAKDLQSTDMDVVQSARKVRDELVAISDPQDILFVGLGVDNEVERKFNNRGDEKAISFVETGRYVFDDNLEIDLGEHQAMVQVTRASQFRLAPLTSVSESPAVQDGSTDEANDGTNGGAATSLHVDGSSGATQETLIRFSLDDFSDPTTISAANLQLSEIGTGAGDAEIYVWNGILNGPAGGVTDWDETNVNWIHIEDGLNLSDQVGEFTQLANWEAGTTTQVDVTAQVQRALLYGDANGDGVFGAAGFDGDIEAFHLAVTNWDAYVAEYGSRANSAADLLARTDGGLGDGTVDTADIVDFFRRHGISQGDYNLDSTVQDNQDSGIDGLDWAVFNANYGLDNARFSQGDGNFDGVVDDDDFDIWFDRKNEDSLTPEEPELIVWVRPEDSTTDIEFAAQEHLTVDGPTLVVTEQPDLALNRFTVDGSNLVVDYAVLGDTFTDVKVQLYQVSSPDVLLHETSVQSGSLGSHEVLIATSVLASIAEGDSIYAKVVGTPSSGTQANTANDQLDFEFSTSSEQTVNSVDDAGMDTLLRDKHTLRELLEANESLGWYDTLSFDNSLFGSEQRRINLGDHDGDHVADRIDIDQDITIVGLSAQRLAIDARNQTQGIFVDTGAAVTLEGIGITGGYASGHGGGIYNRGQLTLDSVIVSDSQAVSHGGGIFLNSTGTLDMITSTIDGNQASIGGGISALSLAIGESLTIDSSTISNNTSSGQAGGLNIVGTAGGSPVEVIIVNSTFSGNSAGSVGGAIRTQTNTELKIVQTTITDNTAASSAGGVWTYPGLVNTVHNSIIAGNHLTGSSVWATDASGNYGGQVSEPSTGNLVGIAHSGLYFDGNINQLGTTATPIDPMLAPLGDYGGVNKTHALLSDGPAIDGADDALAPLKDQRGFDGFNQILEGAVRDIGAFEYHDNWDVNTTADFSQDGLMNLRQAFALSSSTDNSPVEFNPELFNTPQTIRLEDQGNGIFESNILITGDVTLIGPGADFLTVDATGSQYGIRNDGGITALVSGVRVTGASVAGIQNFGNLTLDQVEVRDNAGYGIFSAPDSSGAGSTLNVKNSTIAGNKRTGISLGLANATLSNVTISGNISAYGAGGLSASLATATLYNTTITENRADSLDTNFVSSPSGGIYAGYGGNIFLYNSIVAGNFVGSGEDLQDLTATNGNINSNSSNNLIGHGGSAAGLQHDFLGNIVGDGNGGDIDPMLSELGSYGGPTRIHRLLAGSPAIDKGNDQIIAEAGLSIDQRGFERKVQILPPPELPAIPDNAILAPPPPQHLSDIGAYEFSEPPLVVTSSLDANVELGKLSLRQVLNFAREMEGADTITFAPTVFETPQTILLADQDFDQVPDYLLIDHEVTILGPGMDVLTIDAHGVSGFVVTDTSIGQAGNSDAVDLDIYISDLALTGVGQSATGIANTENLTLSSIDIFDNAGRGILNKGRFDTEGNIRTKLLVVDSRITNSHAHDSDGGGILNANGVLILDRSIVAENSARYGGGIANVADLTGKGQLTVKNSTVSNNIADIDGAGLYISAFDQSMIPFELQTEIINSTVSGNSAAGRGGGVFAEGSDVTFTNTTIAENRGDGAGIHVEYLSDNGSLSAKNTIIVGNELDAFTPIDVAGSVNFSSTSSHNLFGVVEEGITTGEASSKVGVSLYQAALTPLGDFGGPTETHALLPNSIAIDAGDNSAAAALGLAFDQRGIDRTANRRFNDDGNTIDIGSVEWQSFSSLVVTTELDRAGISGELSLREAIALAAPYQTISFDPSLDGNEIVLGSESDLVITKPLVIDATNLPGGLTLRAYDPTPALLEENGTAPDTYGLKGDGGRLFLIEGDKIDVTLRGLTLTGGDTWESGGAIRSLGADLTLDDVDVVHNAAPRPAGFKILGYEEKLVQDNFAAWYHVERVPICGGWQSGARGGGVFSTGNLTILNSTFVNNATFDFDSDTLGPDHAYCETHNFDLELGEAGDSTIEGGEIYSGDIYSLGDLTIENSRFEAVALDVADTGTDPETGEITVGVPDRYGNSTAVYSNYAIGGIYATNFRYGKRANVSIRDTEFIDTRGFVVDTASAYDEWRHPADFGGVSAAPLYEIRNLTGGTLKATRTTRNIFGALSKTTVTLDESDGNTILLNADEFRQAAFEVGQKSDGNGGMIDIDPAIDPTYFDFRRVQEDGSKTKWTRVEIAKEANPVSKPVIVAPRLVGTAFDTPLTFNAQNGNLISAFDPNSEDYLAVTIASTGGTVSLGDTHHLGELSNDGTGSVMFSGPLFHVNQALKELTFTPTSGVSGNASLSFSASDGANAGNYSISIEVAGEGESTRSTEQQVFQNLEFEFAELLPIFSGRNKLEISNVKIVDPYDGMVLRYRERWQDQDTEVDYEFPQDLKNDGWEPFVFAEASLRLYGVDAEIQGLTLHENQIENVYSIYASHSTINISDSQFLDTVRKKFPNYSLPHGMRVFGSELTIKNSIFQDLEEGILADLSTTLVIEDSSFFDIYSSANYTNGAASNSGSYGGVIKVQPTFDYDPSDLPEKFGGKL